MLLAPVLAGALAAAAFNPLAFFAGHTHGTGRLHVMLHHPRAVQVEGEGRLQPDGSLILDQRVTQQGEAATTRRWHLHQTGPGRYTGTLTDAVGPVTAESIGDRLHLAYRTKGKVRIEQWLTLAPDRRSAANRLTARRLGMRVARLGETIRKLD